MKNTRRALAPVFLLVALAAGAVGALWFSNPPSAGNPPAAVRREDAAADAVAAAQHAENKAAQRAVHQTAAALAAAPDSPAVAVARDFNGEAKALLDQANGAPSADAVAAWQKVVAGLLSESAAEREQAARDRAAQGAEISALAQKLTQSEAAHARAVADVRQAAIDGAFWSGWAHRLAALAVLAAGLWIWTKLTHLSPGSLANIVHDAKSGAAPLLHSLDAETGKITQWLVNRAVRLKPKPISGEPTPSS